jgi:phosphoglycolate phosphatase-like HAD superfamily hydrolase
VAVSGVALPSWNDTAAKRRILEFVAATVDEGSPDFAEPADRLATFDNDGTLWVEKPAPPQVDFMFRAFAKAAEEDPGLADEQPYRAVIENDTAFFAKVAAQDPEAVLELEQAVARTWRGTTPGEFEAQVHDFFSTIKQERFGVSYRDLVYKPMLELFELLRANEYRVFVCSGGGRDFMRVIAEATWGILKENVIGTAAEFAYRDGRLLRQDKVLGGVALGPGKPEHIFAHTGRLPLFAGGNADVDIQMLEQARFALLINHDDADREYAYSNAAEEALAQAEERGWTIVSIKDDWESVF